MITLVQENPGIQLINPQAAAADEKTKAGWKHFSLFDKMRELRNNIIQNKDWWTESIAGFDVAVGRSNTLCGWIVGKAARHVETLTEGEVWNLERLIEISMLDMAGPQACCLLVRLL